MDRIIVESRLAGGLYKGDGMLLFFLEWIFVSLFVQTDLTPRPGEGEIEAVVCWDTRRPVSVTVTK